MANAKDMTLTSVKVVKNYWLLIIKQKIKNA